MDGDHISLGDDVDEDDSLFTLSTLYKENEMQLPWEFSSTSSVFSPSTKSSSLGKSC